MSEPVQPSAAPPCLWTEDEDGLWTASCDGRAWSTMDGSPPSDNSMRFCPKCGGTLSEKTYMAAPSEALTAAQGKDTPSEP